METFAREPEAKGQARAAVTRRLCGRLLETGKSCGDPGSRHGRDDTDAKRLVDQFLRLGWVGSGGWI
jgi:hypothetical protein